MERGRRPRSDAGEASTDARRLERAFCRYLQALVDFPDVAKAPPPACAADDTCAADPEFGAAAPPPFKPPTSRARFVFVTRHPLANAVSHSKVLRDSTLPELVAHWIAVATYTRVNENYLAHVPAPASRCRVPAEVPRRCRGSTPLMRSYVAPPRLVSV